MANGHRTALSRLLEYSPLEREQIAVLKTAYEQTLQALHLVDRNDPVTEIVAKRVIEIGKRAGSAAEISKLAAKELGNCWTT